MRKLIASTLVTLDGVIEDPGGFGGSPLGGWAGDYFGPEATQRSLRRLVESELFLAGRRTYESFAAAWPEAQGPYADRLNQMPKLVASRTLTDTSLPWNARPTRDPVGDLRRIKDEPGADIVMYGSPTFMATLLDQGLVDQLDLLRFPVTLGAGQRLAPAGHPPSHFSLIERTVLDGEILACTYAVHPSGVPDTHGLDHQTPGGLS